MSKDREMAAQLAKSMMEKAGLTVRVVHKTPRHFTDMLKDSIPAPWLRHEDDLGHTVRVELKNGSQAITEAPV